MSAIRKPSRRELSFRLPPRHASLEVIQRLLQAFTERHLRLPPEQRLGLRDVGTALSPEYNCGVGGRYYAHSQVPGSGFGFLFSGVRNVGTAGRKSLAGLRRRERKAIHAAGRRLGMG